MVHRLIRNLFIFLLHNFIVLQLLVYQDTHEKYHDLRNLQHKLCFVTVVIVAVGQDDES